VAVFQYTAVDKRREDQLEQGTVVANSEEEARSKLRGLDLDAKRLKRLGGLASLLKGFTADIK
jgi:type II secretory pathway component PulF